MKSQKILERLKKINHKPNLYNQQYVQETFTALKKSQNDLSTNLEDHIVHCLNKQQLLLKTNQLEEITLDCIKIDTFKAYLNFNLYYSTFSTEIPNNILKTCQQFHTHKCTLIEYQHMPRLNPKNIHCLIIYGLKT